MESPSASANYLRVSPRKGTVAGVGTQGLNDFGGTGYDAPCPPRGPAHRYFFRLYALDSALALPPYKTKGDLLKACKGHLLARVELTGATLKSLYGSE
jgi:Raf kinase inhibitor-like YbhB/YbcL family protein